MIRATFQNFQPACLATGIGSLPFSEIHDAIKFVKEFYHEIFFSPQLPKSFFGKNMIEEFFQKIPLTQIENHRPKFILSGDGPNVLKALNNFSPEKNAEGEIFNLFGRGAAYFKTQITGPVTMALNISDRDGKNLFEFPELMEWLKNYLIRQGEQKVKQLIDWGWSPIIFLDEPSLAVLDPVRVAQRRKYLLEILSFFVQGLSDQGAIVGLHCCGQADWSLILESGFQIVSFDASNGIENFLADRETLRKHFMNGGTIAWGLVPTKPIDETFNPHAFVGHFLKSLETICFSPLSLKQVLLQSLITAACGTAGLSLEDNLKVHKQVREISRILRKEVLQV